MSRDLTPEEERAELQADLNRLSMAAQFQMMQSPPARPAPQPYETHAEREVRLAGEVQASAELHLVDLERAVAPFARAGEVDITRALIVSGVVRGAVAETRAQRDKDHDGHTIDVGPVVVGEIGEKTL